MSGRFSLRHRHNTFLDDILQNVSQRAAINSPSVTTSLCRNVTYYLKERSHPVNHINCEVIPQLPLKYQVTSNGKQFLAYDGGACSQERVLFFFTSRFTFATWFWALVRQMEHLRYIWKYTINRRQVTSTIMVEFFHVHSHYYQINYYNQVFAQLFKLVWWRNGLAPKNILV